jgi:hypothetical protein
MWGIRILPDMLCVLLQQRLVCCVDQAIGFQVRTGFKNKS